MPNHYRTIVLSDVHLGSKWSKTRDATRFLKSNSCETLILCGDIIDGWAILRGLPYRSIAGEVKKRVKGSVSYISDFEEHLVKIARRRGCDGVICGHIHHPEVRNVDGIAYLNAGDWIESLSALTEDFDGNWKIHRSEEEKEKEIL
jgi:UDP-2,3-diacylglucosamine pyrophosphatase LpxH